MAVCLSLASPEGKNVVTPSAESICSSCRVGKEVKTYTDLDFSPLSNTFEVVLLNLLGMLNLKSQEVLPFGLRITQSFRE